MRALILALLLLPFAPSAAAAETLDVPPLRVGDRMLYRSLTTESVIEADGSDATAWAGRVPWTGEVETLVTIEGPATAPDEYGVERSTVAFRIERARQDRIVAIERCHVEPAMGWALRWEYLDGGPRYTSEWRFRDEGTLLGAATRYYNSSPLFEVRRHACDGYWQLGYADFREGERPSFDWLFGGTPTLPLPRFRAEVEPARATTWRGGPALEYGVSFDESTQPEHRLEGRARLLFASGFPGPVVVEIEQNETLFGMTTRAKGTRELVGYAPGTGPFPYDIAWRDHPERSPVARFAPQDILLVPDDALGLAFPFREALAAMRADRPLGLAEYLATRPDAALVFAQHEARMEPPSFPRLLQDGPAPVSGPGWVACFADASTSFCARTVRPAGLSSAVSAREEWAGWEGTVVHPFIAASPDDLARLVEGAGVARGSVASLVYVVPSAAHGAAPRAHLTVAQVSPQELEDAEGVVVDLDVVAGALHGAHSASVRVAQAGLLSAAAPPRELSPAHTRAAQWDGLRLENGIPLATAAAAATGLALLALVVKFLLLPLYTRLRRDRLLDNPVRARLYEAIRADPGAHLAQLDEMMGVGKGALRHHVDQLVAHGFVFLLDEGGYSRAFPAGHVPREVALRSALLRAGSHQRVYDLYAARPNASLREAAAQLGMSAPSVHRSKKKLEAAGLLPAAPTAQVGEKPTA